MKKYKLIQGNIVACLAALEPHLRSVGVSLNWDQSHCFHVLLSLWLLFGYRRGTALVLNSVGFVFFSEEQNAAHANLSPNGDLRVSTDVPYMVIEPGMEGQDSKLLSPSLWDHMILMSAFWITFTLFFLFLPTRFFFLFVHLIENGHLSPG